MDSADHGEPVKLVPKKRSSALPLASRIWLLVLLQLPLPAILGWLLAQEVWRQRPFGIVLGMLMLFAALGLLQRFSYGSRLARGLAVMGVVQCFLVPHLVLGLFSVQAALFISGVLPQGSWSSQWEMFLATLFYGGSLLAAVLLCGYDPRSCTAPSRPP